MTNKEALITALTLWMNNIQTGVVTLSSRDAIAMGRPDLVRMINSDQQELVTQLEELRLQIYSNKIKVEG